MRNKMIPEPSVFVLGIVYVTLDFKLKNCIFCGSCKTIYKSINSNLSFEKILKTFQHSSENLSGYQKTDVRHNFIPCNILLPKNI